MAKKINDLCGTFVMSLVDFVFDYAKGLLFVFVKPCVSFCCTFS